MMAATKPDLHDTMPKILGLCLQGEERRTARHISRNVATLATLASNVWDAVHLFLDSKDRADRRDPTKRHFQRWALIGARDGAINLNSFSKVMVDTRTLIRQCPNLEALVDSRSEKAAGQLFREQFPDIDRLRHTAAHPGELSSTPSEFSRHQSEQIIPGAIGGGGPYFVSDTIISDRYTGTYKGATYSYAVTKESCEALFQVALMLWTAWRPMEAQP